MTGFIKQLLLGERGGWRQSHKSKKISTRQRNKIRNNIPVLGPQLNDQEKRIIQLGIIAGSLLGIIREKDLIDDEELKRILDLAQSEANMASKTGGKKSGRYRYHS